MIYAILAVIIGLVALVWSADRFIDGAAATAKHFGMSPLLIGMVIVGFGTSAPEMVVSVLSAMGGSPGIALGNAYGSNITNIALILGVTALISPIAVQREIVKTEMPILLAITALVTWQLWDGKLTLLDGVILLGILIAYMTWTVRKNLKGADNIIEDIADEIDHTPAMTLKKSLFWLVFGLIVLVLSSRLLVWGAVTIAQSMGVSDLIIGLTVVAVGTSLPELASSIAAARKGEHDIALGNIVGSNLFNTLAVVGLATVIHPMDVAAEILNRDVLIMAILTVVLLVFCLGEQAKIGRAKGGLFLATYVAYTVYLIGTAF
ncbi:calcium/sodium antiporter [Kingella kingae]|uniref:calcium/sodium antiporter n=1 Tax=Kingella kingae TaxID=504 RepID=UPI002550AAE2|nr:calcium/sodium antiporter [Kingella kingae]MDK4564794.1 calcium/sodium antiporter [Kingella kingae]MDK4579243.1 calcium/sodium antiporter [Kingella kingae]MDK4609469.1 calcium/sodium antiporter [Kingella kingae]MDK4627485.1 calcium/sodium antiporter [Kingella kingae]